LYICCVKFLNQCACLRLQLSAGIRLTFVPQEIILSGSYLLAQVSVPTPFHSLCTTPESTYKITHLARTQTYAQRMKKKGQFLKITVVEFRRSDILVENLRLWYSPPPPPPKRACPHPLLYIITIHREKRHVGPQLSSVTVTFYHSSQHG